MCVQQGPLCMLACLRLKEKSNSHEIISWQAFDESQQQQQKDLARMSSLKFPASVAKQ